MTAPLRIGVLAGPPPDLSIEPGRYYVDGLAAEALPSDGQPIRYTAQPFYPDPPALARRGGAIVYLDVDLRPQGHPDWRLSSPAAALDAYAAIAAKPEFRGRVPGT